jgi:hypothetical protein
VTVEWRPLKCLARDVCVGFICHEDAICIVSTNNTAVCVLQRRPNRRRHRQLFTCPQYSCSKDKTSHYTIEIGNKLQR